MSTMAEWITAACAELGVDEAMVDQRTLLDLAREVAHQVDRPAAPLTAFLLGIAVGEGRQLRSATDQLLALAARWERDVSPD